MSKASTKLNGVRSVESVEHPQAAQYAENGQRTGQVTSYFNWWMAVDESEGQQNGLLMGFPEVITSARNGEKIRVIGEASTRIVNSVLEMKSAPNGAILVVLEDHHTEVVLYPNLQITPRVDAIEQYWFETAEGEDEIFPDVPSDAEESFIVHGQLQDRRETNVLVTRLIDFTGSGYENGIFLAVGAGQRYILEKPTGKTTVQAWRTANKAASA
ncbi:hypothetical protein IJH02_01445 [Candidatus Saccharibacteria bacterium]|nr:hypothetical protein [Candidatus Saccharibacteria bacterium]